MYNIHFDNKRQCINKSIKILVIKKSNLLHIIVYCAFHVCVLFINY